MKVLYNTQTQSVTPYPRVDDEPVVGLDPSYLVLTKIETTTPSPTAVPSWVVDLDALEYQQVWTEPAPPPPEPDWTAFNMAMLADADWGSWIGLSPLLLSAVTSASLAADLSQLQTGIDAAKASLPDPGAMALARWQGYSDTYHIGLMF